MKIIRSRTFHNIALIAALYCFSAVAIALGS